jgi:hypothetical protein
MVPIVLDLGVALPSAAGSLSPAGLATDGLPPALAPRFTGANRLVCFFTPGVKFSAESDMLF